MATRFVPLAVCGGGGSDAAALIVVLVAVALYVLLVGAVLRADDDPNERRALVGILILSILIGGLVFLVPGGVSGNGDYLGRFSISLALSAVVGVSAPLFLKGIHPGRALFPALAGDVFIPGGLVLLVFAAVGIGTGCID